MSHVVLVLCGHFFLDNIMETKVEHNVLFHSIPISGFNGTSFAASIGKGQNLKLNFGMFCPVELRRCNFELS
jgi:hypothetical protein